nr:unnamed protein product [Naegleria fowleri]
MSDNSTNSTLCHPLLFQLGKFSVEAMDPSVSFGICPDTILTPITSATILLIHLILLGVSGLALFKTRKNGYITSRSPVYLCLVMIGSFIFVFTSCLRFMISRKIYPCTLHTLNMFELPYVVLLPTIFKGIRVFFKYRIALETKNMLTMYDLEKSFHQQQQQRHLPPILSKRHSTQSTTNTLAINTTTQRKTDLSSSTYSSKSSAAPRAFSPLKHSYNNGFNNSRTAHQQESSSTIEYGGEPSSSFNHALGEKCTEQPQQTQQPHYDIIPNVQFELFDLHQLRMDTAALSSPAEDLNLSRCVPSLHAATSPKSLHMTSPTVDAMMSTTTSRQSQFDAIIMAEYRLEDENNINNDEDDVRNTSTTNTDAESTTTAAAADTLAIFNESNDDGLSDYPLTESSFRVLRMYRFIVSYKCVVFVYIILFFLHLILWIVLGAIDYAVAPSYVVNGISERLLTIEVAMFDFTRGCIISNNATYVMAALIVAYYIVELIVIVMTFFAEKDTWFMKMQVVLGIIYMVVSNLQIVKYLTDYFFSYANIPVIYSILEVFVTVKLPCVYAIASDYRKEKEKQRQLQLNESIQNTSVVELFLRNKKTFNILLDYARKSYCCESVLAWKDIQKFKKSKRKQRQKIGKYILKTYLDEDSPVQLNLPSNLVDMIPEWDAQLKLSKPEKKMFDLLQLHCVLDITDVFERLKASDKKVRDIIESWQNVNTQQNQLSMSSSTTGVKGATANINNSSTSENLLI